MAGINFLGINSLKKLIELCLTLEWQTLPVTELPETGKEKVLYLVPVADATGSNLFDEYIWNSETGKFELFGSATLVIDLENYAKKESFNGLKDYVEELKTAIDGIETDLDGYVKADDLVEITADDVQDVWDEVKAAMEE